MWWAMGLPRYWTEPEARMSTIAMANLKGGVGKSTAMLNIAVATVEISRCTNPAARVRVLDMDHQAFATAVMSGRDPLELKATVATMLAGLTTYADTVLRLEDLPWLDESARTAWAGIDLLPSNSRHKLQVSTVTEYWNLRELLGEENDPDTVATFLDCGYGRTDAFTLAMVAADHVIGVTSAAEGGLRGLVDLRRELAAMRPSFGHVNDLAGVITTNFDLRNGPDREILENLRRDLGELILQPMIPRRTVVERAHGAQLPIAALREESARELTSYFQQLAQHLIERTTR